MFTGIIQSLGNVKNISKKNNTFIINTLLDLDDCKIGSSISCDGVCLTITNLDKNQKEYEFAVNVGEETLNRTNIFNWSKNRIHWNST